MKKDTFYLIVGAVVLACLLLFITGLAWGLIVAIPWSSLPIWVVFMAAGGGFGALTLTVASIIHIGVYDK